MLLRPLVRRKTFGPWLLILLLWALTIAGGETRCEDRLERALGLMQQRSKAVPRRYEIEQPGVVYRQRLHSAPIDISVTKLSVEIPNSGSRDVLSWAKVERCAYEPVNNSIRSRVAFNELAVTGLMQLIAYESGASESGMPAESCRMSLRLRRAGIEFYTSPIAKGRGQMRIRTESSFLEPRFASIYAYGCRALATSWPRRARKDESVTRKRELDDTASPLQLASSDLKAVSNSKAPKEDDVAKEESRPSPSSGQTFSSANDVLLDSLWRSRGDIAREMEDIFLRSASQAITHHIEKQLHPAIKETLMLSMGYTISYG